MSNINIPVDPLRRIGSNTKLKSNIDVNILEFLDSLTYNNFILAGNSVANMIENISIVGDLDFWVLNKDKYLEVLTEFINKNPISYDIYPSMINMKFPNLPEVSLILSNKNADETIREL